MTGIFSYADVKTKLTAAGYTVSAGANWLPQDQAAYEQYVKSASYGKGDPNDYVANYAFAYQAAQPWLQQAINGSVAPGTYISSGIPSSGTPYTPGMSGVGAVVN